MRAVLLGRRAKRAQDVRRRILVGLLAEGVDLDTIPQEAETNPPAGGTSVARGTRARIAELEAEVAKLRAELERRPRLVAT